jgi:hypothetical protein
MTQNRSTFWTLLAMLVPSLAFWAQPAFADESPLMVPTRLDFDASHAPKNCNDESGFRSILHAWVNEELLRDDAERRLIVCIQRSSTGGKQADVSLVNAQGVTLAELHTPYATTTECYKVLWAVARDAAKMMGAFDKPPPPEPLVCPAPPTPPGPAEPALCPAGPAGPAPALSRPRMTLPAPFARRAFFGAGVFLGMTIKSEAAMGPAISLGFVPFSRWSGFQIEFDGAYTSRNTQQGFRVDTVPLFASFCYAQRGVRLCGGMISTLFSTEHPKDARDFTLSASLRIGTQFAIAGLFSIRADCFALLPLNQRMAFDTPNAFTAGAVAMGVWSVD